MASIIHLNVFGWLNLNDLELHHFLYRGLRSKRIKRIEHNLAINIKETQKKIWHGVTKDVGYLRKILNEVYFLKFKVSGVGTKGDDWVYRAVREITS
jgi:hypothetical protein